MTAEHNKAMRIRRMHGWNVSPRRAAAIQTELRARWEGRDRLPRIRYVAGADAAFLLSATQALNHPRRDSRFGALRDANRAIAGVIVYRYPEMEEVERAFAVVPLRFPYVPGLLSFRECPALLAAFRKLRHAPDLVFCDAHGYAHPRRFGLACHLGLLLDRPTIGCAKSRLIGVEREPAREAGSRTPLTDSTNGQNETIGAVLRTRDAVRPIYVSQGHRVSLATAIRLTLSVCDGTRIPRPTREADRFVRQLKLGFAAISAP
jgi:deoxyribonuclease V